jgi:uncharacterized protein (DUF1501 family)
MLTRRQLLKSGCALTVASGAAVHFGQAQGDVYDDADQYRALVCVTLGGGADSYNMLVPTNASAQFNYQKRRGHLALNQNELLPLHRGDEKGWSFALHPGMSEIQKLYASNEIAFLANVGPLQGPVDRSGDIHQPDLSHSNLIARWQYGVDNQRLRTGWAGRAADALARCGLQSELPINISLSGRNVMQLGACSMPANLQLSPYQQCSGSPVGVNFTHFNEQLVDKAIKNGRPRSVGNKARLLEKVATESRLIVKDVVADTPKLKTIFASDSFSADMEQVARIIAARIKLQSRRQIFFVQFDGWDQHHELLKNQTALLPILSRGLSAFRDALKEIDAFDSVTTFTTSEFGRCLESNHSGSDHGWGGHQIVMGGAAQGGRIFGDYPDLSSSNPLDVGGGSFMPTTSMDEYLTELVLWLGVPISEMAYVLPDLSKFWSVGSKSPPLGMLV